MPKATLTGSLAPESLILTAAAQSSCFASYIMIQSPILTHVHILETNTSNTF